MNAEDKNASTETIPLADLAAEAANEGAPAQSLPETLPPQVRDDKRRVESLRQHKIKYDTINDSSFVTGVAPRSLKIPGARAEKSRGESPVPPLPVVSKSSASAFE